MNRDRQPDNERPRGILQAGFNETWDEKTEHREVHRQARNLALLGMVAKLAVLAIIVAGGLLYMGYELPPRNMSVQIFDSTGYQPPPRTQFAVTGTVPRTGVERALPDLPNGAIPPQAAGMASPLPADAVNLRRGAVAYANNCGFCHGTTGRGDGPVSEHYTPPATDLTTPRVQGHAPGMIFYQITNGILSTPIPETARYLPREWHSFKGTMTAGDRWATVAFVKSLGAAAKSAPGATAPGGPTAPQDKYPAATEIVPPAEPTPDQVTFPQKPKDVMPGTTSPFGYPSTDPARQPAGAANRMRGNNATTGR